MQKSDNKIHEKDLNNAVCGSGDFCRVCLGAP